jgi:hypothetical protein
MKRVLSFGYPQTAMPDSTLSARMDPDVSAGVILTLASDENLSDRLLRLPRGYSGGV